MSDATRHDNNLGGLTLQGVDDNASGLGVMLELAERLKSNPPALWRALCGHQRRRRAG